ncbi:MAG: DUF1461 domain-containing protein [Nanoarchaeota archaeon]|nr:DUF1461 domain-containing protein [Nanoarchaeota archaeon]MBU1322247.1 DUF1461 domain-containing protein [Nanoarchaeota archaeon]MBU1598227.1 DUF1461 domain-containing protein [Nanoarchaeota archaeon]MBU2441980.1 DUF1461 domain-containing protein [Nanoarchaeota archaeon]
MGEIKKKPTEQKTLVILSAILIIIILFSASFFMVLFDKKLYDKQFEQSGIYEEIGVFGIRNTVDYLIKYLTSGNTEINEIPELAVFSEAERSHLEDVRYIIIWAKALGIAAFVLLIIFILRLNQLKDYALNFRRILIYGGIATLAVLAIIFFLSLNFPAFFDAFHRLLFPQGNYTFPVNYLLIKMFPQVFFNAYAIKMFFHVLIMSLVLIFLGSSSALAFRKTRRN